jgi:hypothetical protein
MRLLGFFLQVAGWIIVLAAIALLQAAPLQAAPQTAFALAGLCIEFAGVTLVVRSHLIPHGEKA